MAGCYITGGSGTALYVEDTGNRYGKPIVFIHGFSQSLLCWKKQLQSHMAKEFRLVAMDIRGHGWSEKPIEEYDSPKNYADDIQAVIKTLKLRHPILVGWSRGGALVCDYLQYYGEGRGGRYFRHSSCIGEHFYWNRERKALYVIYSDTAFPRTCPRRCRDEQPHLAGIRPESLFSPIDCSRLLFYSRI
ncbi:alpha/beta fold hydrolase [Aneurinibacillus migulanus]|uniref:Alpha/beta hydrolase fold n=1 Tax=Aneurinibacillus migulanus TaxID=47500 RepID=A0A1G8IQ77_ANEMI|nr:alpha/beta hydrolase [Aneurinibacillus migulanus]MED0892371.1 alpha/beta hydrolase [Aneurinibacillus migulanus]MED1615677.1 alpha/beta hydrolase [Aneurinibacillus migulanus]SDI21064.1 alpha/beta hydrolase fold [Aneurinibacillus migulanus]